MSLHQEAWQHTDRHGSDEVTESSTSGSLSKQEERVSQRFG